MPSGSLTIVGTGIKYVGHMTLEARAWIEQADKVLFVAAEHATVQWIKELNPSAEPFVYYTRNKPRIDTYNQWIEQMLTHVRKGLRVCSVFYGHPGVFTYASHEAVKKAREEGFDAEMLPGISSLDCLYADLNIDPATHGCQTFGATYFLTRKHNIDTSSPLILWQISLVGETGYKKGQVNIHGLRVLTEVLSRNYGPDHEVIIYEAAQYPILEPVIQRVPLKGLLDANITILSTLFIPPKTEVDYDFEMLDRLNLSLRK